MKALVTGAGGYIGRILCMILKQEGWEVTANDIKYHDSWETNTKDWFIGSYDDSRIFRNNKYDVIFHLGANSLLGPSVKDPLSYFHNNVSKFNTMLYHIVKNDSAPSIIFASSAATYGDPDTDLALHEHHAGRPINPYGWSKFMGEHILEQACLAHGLKGYAMRFFNVAGAYYGLGQDLNQPHILTKMCLASIQNHKFNINGNDYNTYDGTCVRDYIHVADVCDCLIQAAEVITTDVPTSFTEYNVCTQTKTSNLQLANRVKSMFGLYVDFGDSRPGDPGYLYGYNMLTRLDLNWHPTFQLADIIESHYDYVREQLDV